MRGKRFAILVFSIGVALRLWQYVGNPSLWIDEVALARNITDRSAAGLLSPLDYWQVSPVGFLLIEKTAVTLFGPNEWALRLFPLIASIASLALVFSLAWKLLPPGARLLALGLAALSPAFIWHGPEVKHYASDAAVALFILALSLRSIEKPLTFRRALLAGAAGSVAFISFPGILVLAGAGGALAAVSLSERRPLRSYVPTVLLWALVAGVGAILAMRLMSPLAREYQHLWWRRAFAPHSGVLADAEWAWRHICTVFRGNGYPGVQAITALSIAGFAVLGRRGIFLAAPLAVTLAAAFFHFYPFESRLVFFLLPIFLIGFAASIGFIARFAERRARIPAAVTLAAALLPALAGLATQHPVFRTEETRPLISWFASERRPGDAVYAYYGAWQALGFYGPRYGIDERDYAVGGCHCSDRREYLKEIDGFRGQRRLWVIFSHEPEILREREAIVGYLDSIGRCIESRSAPGAWVYLYDVSDPALLQRASVETYALPPAVFDPADDPYRCLGGPQVPPAEKLAQK